MSLDAESNTIGTPILEVLSPSITIEHHRDGQIVAILITGTSREASERFYAAATGYFERQLASGMPIFYLIEVAGNVGISLHFREMSDKFITLYPDITGRAANIIHSGVLQQIAKNFIFTFQARRWHGLTFREFKRKDEALAWLYEGWLMAKKSTGK